MNPESIAFQTDTHGQEANDLFLANFACEVFPDDERFRDLRDDLATSYALEDWDMIPWLVYEIVDRLPDFGYVVIWDNGVFIYRDEDLTTEFWEERY